ncbi:hypothetical protein QBC44DRAFT_311374 [Cladorrhinum sp. PSN332]|nr:hypothetical protein QBC44DRAFT_311374 [Cladorrhinum sp. PSN332]
MVKDLYNSRLPTNQLTIPKAEKYKEAALNVRRLYDSGVPFFTKDGIRRMASLLETAKRSDEKALVVGLDGHTVEVSMRGGKIIPTPGQFKNKNDKMEIETVLEDRIRYVPINTLTHLDDDKHYFPLTFISTFALRDRTSKAMPVHDPRLVRLPLHATPQNFERERALFEGGAQATELRSVLESYGRSNRLPTVKKVVAFACGSISRRDRHGAVALRQHALILFVRDYFAERQKSEVQCFSQEPGYWGADFEMLQDAAVGIKVLEDPWGFIEVDDETVVLSFAPNVPVRQIVADLARPALMFWNRGWHAAAHDTQGLDPSLSIVPSNSTDPMAPRLGNLLKGYWEHPLTDDDDHTFLESAMYIRKPTGWVEEEAAITETCVLTLKSDEEADNQSG